ncbi:MAG: hypothetical protein QXT45_07805 [Candidatus Bilamarchaeaceae archaeon]
MRLGIKMLDSDSTLNDLKYLNQVDIYPGETVTVMFQLINSQSGHRYIPASGATLSAKMYSVNDANNITKAATNPFADDRSIWSFTLNAIETQKLAGVNLELTLTEGTNIKKTWGHAVIVVHPKSPYKA